MRVKSQSRFVIFPTAQPDPKNRLSATYFPEEINLNWANQYSEITIPGQAQRAYQFVSGGARPLTFSLMFDDVIRRRWPSSTPHQAVNWFNKWVPPFDDSKDLGEGQLLAKPVYTMVLFDTNTPAWATEILIRSVKGKIEEFGLDRAGAQHEPKKLVVDIDAAKYKPLEYTSKYRRSGAAVFEVVTRRDPMTGFHVTGYPEDLARLPKRLPSDAPIPAGAK